MIPRFVDYDEVEAGKIKQSFTFLLKDIIRFIAHHVQDGYTLVENTLMTIKNPWEKKVSQNKWDTETSTT